MLAFAVGLRLAAKTKQKLREREKERENVCAKRTDVVQCDLDQQQVRDSVSHTLVDQLYESGQATGG